MIWTALATAGGFLKRAPWQLWAALAVVAVAWWWGNQRFDAGYDKRDREYAAAAAKAVAQARKADGVARDTVDAAKASSAAEIDAAREAAADSDDPWKAATEAMR